MCLYCLFIDYSVCFFTSEKRLLHTSVSFVYCLERLDCLFMCLYCFVF